MTRLKTFIEKKESYEIPLKKTKINGKHITSILPSERTFENVPKYSDGKPKVRFQDWLLIKGGKSEANNRWYGYSHRGIASFGIGDKITGDSLGKKRCSDPDFTIKNDKQAEQAAKTFTRNIS